MPQMTKISSSVLEHILAVEAETATVNEGLLSGRPEIDILYGLWEFPVPYISQKAVQFIQPYFNIGTWLCLWTLI
jgi:hypothetical protein